MIEIIIIKCSLGEKSSIIRIDVKSKFYRRNHPGTVTFLYRFIKDQISLLRSDIPSCGIGVTMLSIQDYNSINTTLKHLNTKFVSVDIYIVSIVG